MIRSLGGPGSFGVPLRPGGPNIRGSVTRGLVTTGLGTAAGVASLGVAASLADRYGLIPPDHGGIYRVGKTLTYATQRLLTPDHAMAREFKRSDISKVCPVNGFPPADQAYERMRAGEFADWRLTIDGS